MFDETFSKSIFQGDNFRIPAEPGSWEEAFPSPWPRLEPKQLNSFLLLMENRNVGAALCVVFERGFHDGVEPGLGR